jgi:mannose-6-phosphate isomerase
VDTRADLYDSAFALFAHAWAIRAGAGREAVIGGAALNHAIDTLLRRPACDEDVLFSGLPVADSRVEQNPHMHLLEASLAWYEAMGDDASAARINGLVRLMESRFVDRSRCGLREVFAESWGPHAEDRFEAGHQYEWVWLLHEHSRICGGRVSSMADVLYRKGRGLTLPNGRIYLSHSLDGDVREPVHRCWGLTEALKAQLALVGSGGDTAIEAVNVTFDRLWEDHVEAAVAGGWLDQLDASGTPISEDIPASTGYHLHLAFAELMRIERVVNQ